LNIFAHKTLLKMSSVVGLTLLLAACGSEKKVLTSSGEMINLLPAENSYLLINYWADWCLPCKEEIPELNQLHQASEKNNVAVLGVNYDALVGSALEEQIARMGIEFPVLVEDPRSMFGFVEPEVLPMTVLVDSDGKVSRVLVGPQTLADIQAELEALRIP